MKHDARVRVAQALAFVALLAALVGALGPAERVRTTYSWPPETLPQGKPEQMWYAPLLLARHRPEALSATVPCALPPALAGARAPATVLATARRPAGVGGLSVVGADGRLGIRVGDELLARVPLGPRPAAACAYRLRLENGRWTLEGGPDGSARGGELEAMPVVFGFFSALDLRSRPGPEVEARTAVHATRASTRQTVAWAAAAVAIAVAFALLAFQRAPRLRAGTSRLVDAARQAGPVDAVVGASLLAWWLLAPAFFDDGWIHAKLTGFSSSEGFSSYYVFLATNSPLGYWLDWLQHWVDESTTLVPLLRLPALVCLAVTWLLGRAILLRVLGPTGPSVVAVWSLASAFLVGVLAWGMTLRPEPLAALLVTAVLLCTVLFLERGAAAPLLVAALLIPLAATAHPSGIVAVAPILAAVGAILRFARRNVATTSAAAAAAIALSLVLLFVGADLEQRRVDARTIRALDTTHESWLDETSRYELLSVAPYGTPVRRALVALIALALVAFVLRRWRGSRGLLDLPALTLGVGMLLLIPTPSKWPSHFGTLLGIAAVGVATEMGLLREDARGAGRHARPLLVLGTGAVAAAWSWSVRVPWNQVDLRTLDWRPGFESTVPLTTLAALLPLVVAASAYVLHKSPSRAAPWAAALVAVPLLAFTVAILALDTARTDSWTHAGQTLESLGPAPDCGLAEDLVVRPGAPFSRRISGESSPTLVLPNLLTYFPCARLPELRSGAVEVPHTIVSYPNMFSPIRYPLTSPFVGVLDLYGLRRLTLDPANDPPSEDVLVYEVVRTVPGASVAPVVETTFSS